MLETFCGTVIKETVKRDHQCNKCYIPLKKGTMRLEDGRNRYCILCGLEIAKNTLKKWQDCIKMIETELCKELVIQRLEEKPEYNERRNL